MQDRHHTPLSVRSSTPQAPFSSKLNTTGPRQVDKLPLLIVRQFRGGLVCKAHRLSASINSRLELNKEEEKAAPSQPLKIDGKANKCPTHGGITKFSDWLVLPFGEKMAAVLDAGHTPQIPGLTTRNVPVRRNVKRFRGGLVFRGHRLVYRSTLG